jgi:hypothetical protein
MVVGLEKFKEAFGVTCNSLCRSFTNIKPGWRDEKLISRRKRRNRRNFSFSLQTIRTAMEIADAALVIIRKLVNIAKVGLRFQS